MRGIIMAAFEPLRMLAALRSHGVSYVLVGGLARAAHGSPIEIDDVDICVPRDDDNLGRLGLALEQLGATPVGEDTSFRTSYDTVAGRLDVIEVNGWEVLAEDGDMLDLGMGVVARVASMGDLIRLSRDAGDLAGAARLSAMAGHVVVDVSDDDDDEEHGPRWVSKIVHALEDVDTFLTDLTFGENGRRKVRS
jgi:hypothetical protein